MESHHTSSSMARRRTSAMNRTNAPDRQKKSARGEWLKRIVSTLIALVTVLGAWVAWRANVAGSEAGDNDSSGLLALQNAEAAVALSYIQANGHQIAYI